MEIKLSSEKLSSYVGDVLPLELMGVKNELAPINWYVIGDVVGLRDFKDSKEDAFTTGVLVSFLKAGDGKIVAEYLGKRYVANVSARNVKTWDENADFQYFFGDMHSHSSLNHNRKEFRTHEYGEVSDLVNYIRREGRIDFGVISDHAKVTNDKDFFLGFKLAEENENRGAVIFAGAESQVMYAKPDRLGVLHRLSGEIVTVNSAGYSQAETWEDFLRDMEYTPSAIAIFAHPHIIGYSTNGVWNFDFKKNKEPRLLEIARGIEMGNGADEGENSLHEYAYSLALDAGFRLSTTMGSDSHGPVWGYDAMQGKTVIMAKEKSKEAFFDAFVNLRFYASESGNVRLSYSVNGKTAPADLEPCKNYSFKINVTSFDGDEASKPVYLEVISDYGNPVYCSEIAGKEEISFDVESEGRYFYLRLVDREGRKTWSPPVFTGRAYDATEEPHLVPIDMTAVRATENGEDASKVINGNPFDSYLTKSLNAEILLDLGKIVNVKAVAYYPHVVLRGKETDPYVELKHILSEYRIESSLDGKSFTECASGRAQILGSENIISFEKTPSRFIKFVAVSSVGNSSMIEKYKGLTAKIANLEVFE